MPDDLFQDSPPGSPPRESLFGDDPDDLTASGVRNTASASALFEDNTTTASPSNPTSFASSPAASRTNTTTGRPNPRRDSYDPDPWASPDLHRGHNHNAAPAASSSRLAAVETGDGASISTTGGRSSLVAIKSSSHMSPSNPPSGQASMHQQDDPESDDIHEALRRSAVISERVSDNTWGGFTGQNNGDPPSYNTLPGSPYAQAPGSANILESTGIQPLASSIPAAHRRSLIGPEERIVITCLPDKDGPFMFQHRNYQLKAVRSGKEVVRRYSDFVWLLETLKKRYPVRCLPLVPPKTLTVNGHHFSSDNAFLERRRRGLIRFSNALFRHPKLRKDPVVTLFLESTNEVSQWRKQASDSVRNEFFDSQISPNLEASLEPNLDEKINTARGGIKRSAEIYNSMCNLLDRLQKRNKGLAGDYYTFNSSLARLSEETTHAYCMDPNEVPLIDQGLREIGKHYGRAQVFLVDEAKSWEDNVLEDMKRQRDLLNGMRDMFDRMDRELKTDIPKLEKRIDSNKKKLEAVRAKEEIKPGEIEKIEQQIHEDGESIVMQIKKGIFTRAVVKEELEWFVISLGHVSKFHQEWASDRVKYAELHVENWKSLLNSVEGMPTGD